MILLWDIYHWWLVELPKWFTTAMHKCVSLFWWTFFGTFSAPRSHINVLNIYACPHLNVETNLRGVAGKLNQWKNWINRKFASAILSFWVQKGHLSFPMSENGCWPLWKMGKMAIAPQKRVLEQNFQLPTPLKFGSLVFRVLTETQNWCRPLQKMGQMAVAPQKRILEQNFQLLTPLKFGFPVFWMSMEMQNWCQPLRKMGKIAIALQKCVREQNFQLPTP